MTSGTVLLHLTRPRSFLATHEGRVLERVAQALARVLDREFGGCYTPGPTDGERCFFVPDETLLGVEAERLGIRSDADLFGGIVPEEFVRTKAITHDLVNDRAARPKGWSQRFAARVRDVVLPGYTVFTRRDAERAALLLLGEGRVRVKRPLAAGGRGQTVLDALDELDGFLADVTDAEMARAGLVLEMDLDECVAVSIGQLTVGDFTVSYHGRQRVTRDNTGREVYGGSDLVCVRGGFTALERLPTIPDVRRAIRQARQYHEAACAEYGVMVSRRNYDVAQGLDATGQWWSGVLEQGWRAGGASCAEVMALEAFAADPGLHVLAVSSVELYGAGHAVPPEAVVHFSGVDPNDGPILRYALARYPMAKVA